MNAHRALVVSLIAFGSPVAYAQNVPAIQTDATAAAQANQNGATASAQYSGTPTMVGSTTATKLPEGWPPASVKPPPVHVPLDPKEAAVVKAATAWRNKSERPSVDRNGVQRWIYGNTQTRVVCAPKNYCDIELKANEIVNNVRLGDDSFWDISMTLTSGPDGRTTHVLVKPVEAGHPTSILIYTDQDRTYTIKLIAQDGNYTPKTGFIYPGTDAAPQDVMALYRAAVGKSRNETGASALAMASDSTALNLAQLEMLKIDGDNPSWRPYAAYTNGQKTYIRFPSEMQFGDGPALLGVVPSSGWFSSATDKRVIYRWVGSTMIADVAMDKLQLVLGVGSAQQKVTLTRTIRR